MKSGLRFAAGAALALLAGAAVARAQGACAGDPSGARLRVVVQGVRSSQGDLTATLYGDDPSRWLKSRGEIKVWREPALAPTTNLCVWLPGPGNYGLVVYHDTKRVGHFVRGTFGPTQDYGFSRNPRLFLGPPSINQVKFPAGPGETTIFVSMKYP